MVPLDSQGTSLPTELKHRAILNVLILVISPQWIVATRFFFARFEVVYSMVINTFAYKEPDHALCFFQTVPIKLLIDYCSLVQALYLFTQFTD